MTERESIGRTLGVATAVALICSLFVTTAVTILRPYQRAYQSLERSRAVLEAAALAPPGSTLTDREIISGFLRLEKRIVDLDSGRFTDEISPTAYDYRDALIDAQYVRKIPSQLDIAKIGSRPRYMPAYLSYAGKDIELVVLPVYGRGMWSTIHGYVSIAGDLKTIAGASFHEHGETPGIGDRIQDAAWLAQWSGVRLYDEAGNLRFRIGPPERDPAATAGIHAITGATVTVNAIERTVRYWFGPHGYGPLLARLREGGG